jgi:large subunit ribosomal protein L15
MHMRMPKLPGFTNRNRVEYSVVNVSRLELVFSEGDIVSNETLVEKGITKSASELVKVLGDGEVSKKFVVRVDKVSGSAKAKIEAAGGTVETPC